MTTAQKILRTLKTGGLMTIEELILAVKIKYPDETSDGNIRQWISSLINGGWINLLNSWKLEYNDRD